MSAEEQRKRLQELTRGLPQGEAFKKNIARRRTIGTIWRTAFLCSIVVGLIALAMLLYNVADEAFGLIALEYKVQPEEISDVPLEELDEEQLIAILREYVRPGLLASLEREAPLEERSREGLLTLVRERVLNEQVVASYPLHEALFNRAEIEERVLDDYPTARFEFYSWINRSFLMNTMSSTPAFAGVRTALFGTLWMIGLTMLFAVPIGIGAAIYLEEYATPNRINQMIQTNINNLAGVPSIIYGLLGLAIFVRALEPITSGQLFGLDRPNGRTILSASMTMALLILPLLIINAQEAIRAVPNSLRQASYGLGATKWQTVWNHVLPVALPGILTGTILSMSRAIGETAPLIVVGASTFIAVDPDGPFSGFTVLPIQIYNWTARPQDQFRDIAAAAIIVLLVLLLTLNSIAVILRNRFAKRL